MASKLKNNGDPNIQKKIEEVAAIIVKRRHVVAFSGSGVSKESGIPTFREPDGLWSRYEAGASGGIMGVVSAYPDKAADILDELLNVFRKAQPNPGHLALVEFEKLGLLDAVITQNIDNLHREAGNTKVYELHGNLYRLRCVSCGRKELRERGKLLDEFGKLVGEMRKTGIQNILSLAPHCECGGLLRPDFVAFGEPVQDLHEAIDAASRCHVMLVLGTSGVVYPAASLPSLARNGGATIIEINPERSALTHLAGYFLQGQTGVILPGLVKEARKRLG